MKKRVAFFGGSFDPVHKGHMAIGGALLEQFELDEFVFIPAFHAPHKLRKKPTSAYDRFAMLCLATQANDRILVSKLELEAPERPYSVDTLTRLTADGGDSDLFFVMGADSWQDITTWRQWETVLSLTNHIVVTRPGVEIGFGHVGDDVRSRIIDLRHLLEGGSQPNPSVAVEKKIYFTDSVSLDISATDIRRRIREGDDTWRGDVPVEVANYIEKYQIYS
jgi:nicotinate-nucleotide adenylyltransferase